MQDRPDASELLDAVADFLENEVLPELSGRSQFHARVSVNVLRTLKREWESEEVAVRQELARLTKLLGSGESAPASLKEARAEVIRMNKELSERIRRGEFDERWDELESALRMTALEKLRIANPSYE